MAKAPTTAAFPSSRPPPLLVFLLLLLPLLAPACKLGAHRSAVDMIETYTKNGWDTSRLEGKLTD